MGISGPRALRGAVRGFYRRAPLAEPDVLRGLDDEVRGFRGEEEAAALARVRALEPPVPVPLLEDALRPLREAPRCDGEESGMAWWSCVKARDSGAVTPL
jgi:hypothetical protein